MPKNIVILCDGTSNEISEDRTNILRLYGALVKSDQQIVFYDPGVGTFGAANSMSYYYRRSHEVWGLISGWGLDQNVKEAYRFLVNHYDDGMRQSGKNEEPDQIFLFGFSRGAYTARVLAGFIHAVGLIEPINLNLLDYAYGAYKDIPEPKETTLEKEPDSNAFAEVRLYERILRPRRPVIRCIGVFDTVGSVIEWGRSIPRFRTHAFTKTNQSVQSVRHAVSIDERRTLFHPQLWSRDSEYWGGPFRSKSSEPQDVKEVWFSGVHGDVGGGYPENKSQLAKIPLKWMIDETKELGLKYKTRSINSLVLGKDKSKHYVSPNPVAARNESMNKAWPIAEVMPRMKKSSQPTMRLSLFGLYIPWFENRHIPSGAAIHSSVFERRGTVNDYDQPNIPDRHVVV